MSTVQNNNTDNNNTVQPVDTRVTVCPDCHSTEYKDVTATGSRRISRYCNGDINVSHSMGYFDPSESPAGAGALAEPATALVPIDTATSLVDPADFVADIKAEHEACVTAHAACLTACADS